MSRFHGNEHSKAESDNPANQMDQNNYTFWKSRGHDERPDDWEGRAPEEEEDG